MTDEVQKVSKKRRVGALVLSLMHPGCGHMVLGRWERGLAWALAMFVFQGTLLFAGVVGVALVVVAQVGSLVDVLLVRPLPRGLSRAGVALALVLGVWGTGLAIAKLNRRFIAEPFHVPSESMRPTLLVGDQFMLDRTVGEPWKRRALEHGDIVVFPSPEEPERDYVKRVVALGGDRVAVRQGLVFVNGAPLAQGPHEECGPAEQASVGGAGCELHMEGQGARHYAVRLDNASAGQADFPHEGRCPRDMEPREDGCAVAPGALFVLGDNRFNSYDSRSWGVVPEEQVKGVAAYIHFSLSPEGAVRWERLNQQVR